MIGIEAIFAIGGLAMIAAGLMGGLEFEKFKVPQLPNWVRATAIVTGIALLSLSIYIFPQSPFNPSSDLRAKQIAFEATQTAFYNLPTLTPIIQTAEVTQPAIVITQAVTQNTEEATIENIIPIESLGVTIWDNSGQEEGDGESSSTLTVISYPNVSGIFYELVYTLTDDNSNVGLAFGLREKTDISKYSALQFTIRFKDDKTRCKFTIWGETGAKTILLGDGLSYADNIALSINETPRGKEHTFTIPVNSIFKDIGLTQVGTFEFYTDSSTTGESRNDSFVLSNISYIK